ncbi:MAG TPA: hypothetical protein PLY85_11135, partial [Anaerolineaceae bacterium]|nr:hypothetical protein [Anaerolineaceae bacterium]
MHGMKRIISVAAIVVVLSFAIVGTVVAFTMGNVDGLWGYIDGVTENSNTYTVRGGGAICSRWATGPVSGSSNYDSPTSTSNWNTIIQGALGGTDWNQVRYGATDSDCDSCLPFGSQSGFGFEGENDVIDPDAPYLNIPFLLG